MSVKTDLETAFLAMRGTPSFDNLIKTLTARREFVVNQLIAAEPHLAEALRGEVRAYDYILKANSPRV